MTTGMNYAPRRLAMPAAALAAVLLAGCSSGNIGESWQCPLAKGGSCDSVAAADPAVPDARTAGGTVLKEPLWRARPADLTGRPETPPCEAACGGGFDPFGWLARLFDWGAGDEHLANAKSPSTAAAAPVPEPEPEPAEPATASLPADSVPSEDDPGGDSPRGEGLRTGEVVARIWIAPFVDADGVYREASHVRVVLEPAGWRLK